ncbi:MAG: TetR/AcrR family transcriptional regulator C-terminal domain-containing protein, partial [Arenicellales bacterium]
STRLNLLIERQMNFIAENKGLPRLLFSDQLHLESSALKEAVQNVMQGYITQVQRLLQEGIDEGVFKAKINTQASAKLVAALIQGTVMRWSIFDYTFNLNDEIEPIQSILTAALQSNSYSRSTN